MRNQPLQIAIAYWREKIQIIQKKFFQWILSRLKMNLLSMKFIYLLSYIEHSWRFIRTLLYFIKLSYSPLIFFGYIRVYVCVSVCFYPYIRRDNHKKLKKENSEVFNKNYTHVGMCVCVCVCLRIYIFVGGWLVFCGLRIVCR